METNTEMNTVSVANCFLVVDDYETALAFYRDLLGFSVHTDITHEGFRWLSVTTPTQPDLEITLGTVADQPGASDADRAALSDLLAKGHLGALIFDCDDVDAIFERLTGAGAEVLQEPADQFYGVRDCAFRDPAGNMVRFKSALDDLDEDGMRFDLLEGTDHPT